MIVTLPCRGQLHRSSQASLVPDIQSCWEVLFLCHSEGGHRTSAKEWVHVHHVLFISSFSIFLLLFISYVVIQLSMHNEHKADVCLAMKLHYLVPYIFAEFYNSSWQWHWLFYLISRFRHFLESVLGQVSTLCSFNLSHCCQAAEYNFRFMYKT